MKIPVSDPMNLAEIIQTFCIRRWVTTYFPDHHHQTSWQISRLILAALFSLRKSDEFSRNDHWRTHSWRTVFLSQPIDGPRGAHPRSYGPRASWIGAWCQQWHNESKWLDSKMIKPFTPEFGQKPLPFIERCYCEHVSPVHWHYNAFSHQKYWCRWMRGARFLSTWHSWKWSTSMPTARSSNYHVWCTIVPKMSLGASINSPMISSSGWKWFSVFSLKCAKKENVLRGERLNVSACRDARQGIVYPSHWPEKLPMTPEVKLHLQIPHLFECLGGSAFQYPVSGVLSWSEISLASLTTWKLGKWLLSFPEKLVKYPWSYPFRKKEC